MTAAGGQGSQIMRMSDWPLLSSSDRKLRSTEGRGCQTPWIVDTPLVTRERTGMTPNVPFLLIVAGSTLIDMAVAGVTLFLTPGPIGARRVARAALTTGAVFLVKLVILAVLGVARFGQIHLLYADLVILLPAAGAALLFRRRLTVPVRVVALASLGMVPVGVYATWVEPFRLRLETARAGVSTLRDGNGVVRIGVLSDLQTDGVTDYERGAVDRLMAEKPDVILLPGDVFQGTQDQFETAMPGLWELLNRLSAPGGVYLVLGDTDGTGAHLQGVLGNTEVRILVNEAVRVQGGRPSVDDRRSGAEVRHRGGPRRHTRVGDRRGRGRRPYPPVSPA